MNYVKVSAGNLFDLRKLGTANKIFRDLRPRLREQALHFDAKFGTTHEQELKKYLTAIHQIIEEMEDKVSTPPEEEPMIFSRVLIKKQKNRKH